MKLNIKSVSLLIFAALSFSTALPMVDAGAAKEVTHQVAKSISENAYQAAYSLARASANVSNKCMSYLPGLFRNLAESCQGIEKFTVEYPGASLALTAGTLLLIYQAGFFHWIGNKVLSGSDKALTKVHETRESLERRLAVYRGR